MRLDDLKDKQRVTHENCCIYLFQGQKSLHKHFFLTVVATGRR